MNDTLYLHGLVGGAAAAEPTPWERPADWLPMPASISNSVDMLVAVFDHDANFANVSLTTSTGTYSVDWGDGTSTTGVASNAITSHTYSYSTPALDGSECSRGYRQALIRITPDTGTITGINVFGSLALYSTPTTLDLAINAPTCSATPIIGGYNTAQPLMERCEFVAIGNLTALAYLFRFCSSLQSVTFPAGSLSAVTNLSGAFQNCSSLQSISFPAGSLSAVTNLTYAFTNCFSLQSISFPAGSLAAVTNLTYPFTNCFSLQSISFPAGSLSAVTNLTQAFYNCSSLQSISFPAGSLSAVTDAANAFSNSYALADINNCAIPVSFSIANAKLSAAALDEIYTALPTVTAKTITVTGNFGTAGDDPSIATAKGWTVTS